MVFMGSDSILEKAILVTSGFSFVPNLNKFYRRQRNI